MSWSFDGSSTYVAVSQVGLDVNRYTQANPSLSLVIVQKELLDQMTAKNHNRVIEDCLRNPRGSISDSPALDCDSRSRGRACWPSVSSYGATKGSYCPSAC